MSWGRVGGDEVEFKLSGGDDDGASFSLPPSVLDLSLLSFTLPGPDLVSGVDR